MRISHRKSTLHRLPPAGVRWEWGDVIAATDDDDGVSQGAFHAVRGLLDKHRDGRYETTPRLERYLAEKHEIELTSRCERQARLPIDSGPACESAVAADGSVATGEPVQLGLDGEDMSDAVAERGAREDLAANVSAGKAAEEKHLMADRDTRQATIAAYANRVRVGSLAKRRGDTYPDVGTHVSVESQSSLRSYNVRC